MLRLWNQVRSTGSDDSLSKEEALLMKTVEQLPRKPLSKDELVKMNPYLLAPEDVGHDVVVDNPFELGHVAQLLYAEKIPSVRLWIHFKEYVIGGVPDGITGSYVYEFKSTFQKDRRLERVKDQALHQALIYRYAFKRPNIKVQVAQFQLTGDVFPIKVRDLPKPDIATISKPASESEALAVLQDFDRAFHASKKE